MPTAVSLSQMVDLSLGTPEVGAVNFNVMHSLLHAIIKKLNISDYKADINEHDRDFLATSVRAKSIMSDADSGKGGDESEDGISEKSGIPPFRPTPYHRLELKVEKLAQQLEDLNQLPSNVELYNRATKSKGDSKTDRPVADMWQYMQMKKRVDANEEGIGKLFSLIEDMMKEMKELKDANQALQDKIKGLNVDDLKKRLGELEKITTDLNEKFLLLPSPEELSQFVTWPALEDALKGVRDDLAPADRVVIEMSSQTEPDRRVMSPDLIDNNGKDKQIMTQTQTPNTRSNANNMGYIDNGHGRSQGAHTTGQIGDQYVQDDRHGGDSTKQGLEGTKQGSEGTRQGSEGTRQGVEGPREGSEGTRCMDNQSINRSQYTDDSTGSEYRGKQASADRSGNVSPSDRYRNSTGYENNQTPSPVDPNQAVPSNFRQTSNDARQVSSSYGQTRNTDSKSENVQKIDGRLSKSPYEARQSRSGIRRQPSRESMPSLTGDRSVGRSDSNMCSGSGAGGNTTTFNKRASSGSSMGQNKACSVQKTQLPAVNMTVSLVTSQCPSLSDGTGTETRPTSGRHSHTETLITSRTRKHSKHGALGSKHSKLNAPSTHDEVGDKRSKHDALSDKEEKHDALRDKEEKHDALRDKEEKHDALRDKEEKHDALRDKEEKHDSHDDKHSEVDEQGKLDDKQEGTDDDKEEKHDDNLSDKHDDKQEETDDEMAMLKDMRDVVFQSRLRLRQWPSRPNSSRPVSRLSTPGPSEQLLDVLERLGKLDTDHKLLKDRVDIIEEELKNKLDKSAIEGLGVSAELLEQIGKLKEELDALSASRDKNSSTNPTGSSPESVSTKTLTNDLGPLDNQSGSTLVKVNSRGGSLHFLASVVTMLSKIRKSSQECSSEGTNTDTGETANTGTDVDLSSSEEILNVVLNSKMSETFSGMNDIHLSSLQQRVGVLEDRFKLFQEMLLDDTSHHTDVSDLTSWLAQMENKIADNLTDINSVEESKAAADTEGEENKPVVEQEAAKKEESEKSAQKKKKPREEVEEHQAQEDMIKDEMDKILDGSDVAIPEMTETNDKLKKLAYNLNDQLHGLRDKVFLVDQELKRMAKGVEFALMRAKVAGINEMDDKQEDKPDNQNNDEELQKLKDLVAEDSDALTRAQQAILQLQAEVEKLHHTTSDIIDENKQRTQQIEDILKYCDKLQQQKADKDYVQMEVDVKADKKSLEAKVNTKLFDQTTDEINKMIKEILDKLAGHDEDWKTAYSKLTEDIDGKLDRLELDPLKEWLESRLKALNDKLKKYQKNMDWSEDDAAGIRKQLIQRFHCISCDRPVDMMPTGPIPSLPAQGVLPATRSPRPYTTYELEQIRQHAKSRFSIGRNTINFERAIAERQLASMKKSDLQAFLVHFKQDMDMVSSQVQQAKVPFANPEVTDYYATPRPCGGSHTLTYPHKRNTKLTHLSHLFRDETIVVPANTRDEGEIQGADGHIYRGRPEQSRHHKLEARLPTTLGGNNNNMSVHVRSSSPHPPQSRRPASSVLVTQRARPISARTPPSPRPSSAGQALQQGSRPQSAKVIITQESGEMAQIPQAEFTDEPVDEVQATMDVNKQEPLDQDKVQLDVETA